MTITAILFCIIGIYLQVILKRKNSMKPSYKFLYSLVLCVFVGSSMKQILSSRNSILVLCLIIIIPIYFYLFVTTITSKTDS